MVFSQLVGATPHAGAVFDQYVTSDGNETTVAGTARWDDLLVAASVKSDEGEELLERDSKATEEEFQRNFDQVNEAPDEQSLHVGGRPQDLSDRHADLV